MNKFMILVQLAMSIFMFISIIVWGIVHAIKGTIGFIVILVVLLFAYLMWRLVRLFWVEYQQEKDK